ncbi:ABC transporter permease, partial [bacterium M00.F.Ca.ET.177.01.1.1]
MNEGFSIRQVFEGKWTQGAIPLVLLVALLLIIEIA